MKQQKEDQRTQCDLPAAMDLDDKPQLQLPHFFNNEEAIPRISKQTMIEILDGKYKASYEQSLIIDCRFEYEYSGGHIDGAVNFNDKDELASQLFHGPLHPKTMLIFHCEYSAHRAPLA